MFNYLMFAFCFILRSNQNPIYAVVITFLLAAQIEAFGPGNLDPTFGPVGFVTTSLSSGADRAYAAARQADGKIILAGTRNSSTIALVRYNPNGTLDTSFDSDGIVTTTIGTLATANAVAIQSDGKIVVAATASNAAGQYLLLRYNINGSLDLSFDGDGIFIDNTVGIPKALVIQSDGKILTAGSRTEGFFTGADYSVVRHNPDGSFDTTFDSDGKVVTPIGDSAAGGEDSAYALTLQPDGKILVVGESNFLYTARDFSVVRYNSNGSLDTSFDGDGKVQTAFGGNMQIESARAITVLTNGQIVVAGLGGEGSESGFALAKYNSDGSLDTAFGGDGKVITSTSGGNETANAVIAQSDGKIVAAGNIGLQIGLVRYNPDGTLDSTFSGDGKVLTTVYESGAATARSALIEPDGKILVAGNATIGGSTDEDFVFARYNTDGSPLIELGTFGRVTTNLFDVSSEANDVVVQPDGKILVAGTRYINSTDTAGAIVRYTADGRIDTTFNSSTSGSGVAAVYVPGANNTELNRIGLQPDGKILAVGTYEGQSDAGFYVIRFKSDGTRDTTFNNSLVTVSVQNGGGTGQDIALQPDGKIIVAGAAVNINDQTVDFAVYRFNANGTLDTAFGANGASVLSLGNGNDIPFSVAVQSDGKIILAGAKTFSEEPNSDIALVRFNANGSIDNSFGTNGIVITELGGFIDVVTKIRLQADQKIVAAALNCTDAACAGGKAVALRYNVNGSLDSSFDSDGMVFPQITDSFSSAAASIAVQNNGKIVVAGESLNPITQSDSFVARYNPDGSPDPSFGTNGVVTDDINNSQQSAISIGLQSDGKIVLAGSSLNGTRTDFTLWRFLGDARIALSSAPFDFDGDGKTDISIYRPSIGEWWYLKSSSNGNGAFQFGASTDKMVPADYTGGGKTDVAFFRPSTGEWFVLRSEDASFYSFPFGTNEDIPVPADYDADGKADAAVFRPSTNTWYISKSTGGTTIQTFGAAGDVPVVADYDGDNKADIAIYRPSKGEWWINRSSAGSIAFQFGSSADKPVQGDYTGDGKADVAFFRPSTGEWFVLRSENQSFYSFPFGTNGDVPSPGDYDGDGKSDAAVFRPSNNTWFVQRTTSGTLIQTFGQTGDKPVPSSFIP